MIQKKKKTSSLSFGHIKEKNIIFSYPLISWNGQIPKGNKKKKKTTSNDIYIVYHIYRSKINTRMNYIFFIMFFKLYIF